MIHQEGVNGFLEFIFSQSGKPILKWRDIPLDSPKNNQTPHFENRSAVHVVLHPSVTDPVVSKIFPGKKVKTRRVS